MPTYEIVGDPELDAGYTQTIEAASIDDAVEHVCETWPDGDYGQGGLHEAEVTIRELDDDGEPTGVESVVRVIVGELPDPPETICGSDDDDHAWRRPYEMVGGCESNPGVWAEGGTSYSYHAICARCGLRRVVRRPGSQRGPDEPYETREYETPGWDEVAWLASRRLPRGRRWDEETRQIIWDGGASESYDDEEDAVAAIDAAVED